MIPPARSPEPAEGSAPSGAFTPEQKEYLAGFMAGVSASGVFVGTNASGQFTASPDSVGGAVPSPRNLAAPAKERIFNTPLGDLCKEERWKYDENPLDAWDRLLKHADENNSRGSFARPAPWHRDC